MPYSLHPKQAKDYAEIQIGFSVAAAKNLVYARLAGACITAFIAGHWLGPTGPSLWLVVVAAYEFWLSPFIHHLIERREQGRQDIANHVLRAGMVSFGSLLYLAPCVAAWIVAGGEFAGIGSLYIACLLVHAAQFRAGNLVLATCALGPPALAALILPLLAPSDPLVGVLSLLAAAQVLFVVVMSIQSRRRLIEATVRFRSEAIAFERASDAKSQFLSMMSHELRTPLNAVIGYAELLEEELAEGGKCDPDDAKRIAAAGRSLLVLVNDVLDLQKIEAGRLEMHVSPTSVSEIVRGVVETCQQMASTNGNTITTALDARYDMVDADALRLRQCLLNLVSNACKFTHGGAIRVSTKVLGDTRGPRLALEVQDTGIGISPTQMSKLFQPFVQVDQATTRAYSGTGLGLVITRRLCELMGADVSLESVEGKGTLGTLTMPLTRQVTVEVAA